MSQPTRRGPGRPAGPSSPGRQNRNPFPEVIRKDIPLKQQFREFLVGSLTGRLTPENADSVELENLKARCRRGNPFPLIAHYWPHLVVRDAGEREIFRRNLLRIVSPETEAHVTDGMRDAILNAANPVLRLDWWQHVILAGFFDPRIGEIYIKGCTGAGKGAAVSIAVNLWFDVYRESRTHLTGPNFAHTVRGLFGEVVKWRSGAMTALAGRALTESILDSERHYITVLNPDTSDANAGEKFSGAHGQNTLYGFDEATVHPEAFFLNARKNARMIVALANPRTMAGPFRTAFDGLPNRDRIGIVPGHLRMRLCVTVAGPDCINVAEGRIKEPVAPKGGITIDGVPYGEGQLIDEQHRQKVALLIPDQIDLAKFRSIIASPDKKIEVPVFGFGRFPDEDPERQVILPSWLPRHQEAWVAAGSGQQVPVTCFGLDVARSLAGDRTVLVPGGDQGVREFLEWRLPDVTQTADRVVSVAKERYGIDLTLGQNPVCIDYGGGYGSGVGDLLRRRRVWVIEFQPSARSNVDPRRFANLRTEGYGVLAMRLDPAGPFGAVPFCLPTQQDLAAELVAPEKVFVGNDAIRFRVEPKEDIKAKLNGRSPDLADGTVYLFHGVCVFNDLWRRIQQYSRELVVWPQPSEDVAKAMDDERKKQREEVDERTAKESAVSGIDATLKFDLGGDSPADRIRKAFGATVASDEEAAERLRKERADEPATLRVLRELYGNE